MRMRDVVQREPVPEPWTEEEKIPWDDPEFSRRMLHEHLSQEHDAASRRSSRIATHVHWIHDTVLQSRPSRILDLGCGPGLYTAAFAGQGHTCVGIDFAPASIEHARQMAGRRDGSDRYILGDMRALDFGNGFDLVMLIFGEINVFRPEDARLILAKARAALNPGGVLLLEAHTWNAVWEMGSAPSSWSSRNSGLFSTRPHLQLQESFWIEDRMVAIQRYYIVDAATADVSRYGQCVQAYSDDGYRALFEESGFDRLSTYTALDGTDDRGDFVVLLGRTG